MSEKFTMDDLKTPQPPKGWLNPRVPLELRVTEINRLNELIDRDKAKPIVEVENVSGYLAYCCARCGMIVPDSEDYVFCHRCGQRLDTRHIDFVIREDE